MNKLKLVVPATPSGQIYFDLLAQKIRSRWPGTELELIQEQEHSSGTLDSGRADLAVYDLGDLDNNYFFGDLFFAAIERRHPGNFVLFHPNAALKIREGAALLLGVYDEAVGSLAIRFLKRALPVSAQPVQINMGLLQDAYSEALRKLDQGKFDALLLPVGELDRLLESKQYGRETALLLQDKRKMLLPVLEACPRPGQGALVACALRSNKEAVHVLAELNDSALMQTCVQEKQLSAKLSWQHNCKVQAGSIVYDSRQSIILKGEQAGQPFVHWWGLPNKVWQRGKLFSCTDYMRSFFVHKSLEAIPLTKEPAVYLSGFKALQENNTDDHLKAKRIWVAGSKTWFEMARRGYWIEGSAEGLGLNHLQAVWRTRLFNTPKSDIRLFTQEQLAGSLREQGWQVTASYRLQAVSNPIISLSMQQADWIFWTSFQQFEHYNRVLNKTTRHACPATEAAAFRKAGVEPLVYPGIQAFLYWRNRSLRQEMTSA